jgi:hypothetical protein
VTSKVTGLDARIAELSALRAELARLSLTVRPVLRAGSSLRQAVKVALAADTLSIVTRELVDNGVMLAVPAMAAGLGNLLFWGSLTLPVNRWLIARGKGHAVVHVYHH